MRTNQLTARHLQLLIALQEDPMARLDVLAKRVGLSRTTVASYLKWLSGENPLKKRYFRVVPDFNEDALNMRTIDVLFDTPDYNSLRRVEEICDKHPYTKYRARCYGGLSHVFAQFRIPKGTKPVLSEYLRDLKRKEVFQDFRVLPTKSVETIFTVPRLEHWDIDFLSWNFDWSDWLDSPIDLGSSVRSLPADDSKLGLLTRDDVYILSILPRGVRRKQKEMISDLKKQGVDFTSQEFSRRLKMLNEHFVSRYHVYVDIAAFDLYSNVIITATCEPEFSQSLKDRLATNPLPFRSTLKISDDFFFWYLRMPSSHLSELVHFLHPNVDSLWMSNVDYTQTEVYILWPSAFNGQSKEWITEEEFMRGGTVE